MGCALRGVDYAHILIIYGAAAVNNGKDKLRRLNRAAAALHTEALHRVAGIAYTGGIRQAQQNAADAARQGHPSPQ